MKPLILFVVLLFCSACTGEHDGLHLTDTETGKKYLIDSRLGVNYDVLEEVIQISGKDTIITYK